MKIDIELQPQIAQSIGISVKVDTKLSDVTAYWLTGRRKLIPIRSMETSHIKFTIACLEGRSKKNTKIPQGWGCKSHDEWLSLFYQELSRRN